MAWKNINSGWNYRYVSAKDRSIQVEKFDQTLHKFYLLADKVTQADLWRYITVYQNGGIYADMDSYCTAPLDYILEKNYKGEEVFAVAQSIDGKYIPNNANFGATINSNIIKTVIDNIYERYKNITLYNALTINGGNLDFLSGISVALKTEPEDFSSVLMKNQDKVCLKFTNIFDGEDLKHSFYPDYPVDYYGDKKPYSTLALINGWALS